MPGCGSPTSVALDHPTVAEVQAYRARWDALGIGTYSFTYEFSAFTALAGQSIRLAVSADTVRRAVLLGTNQALDDPGGFPTIDGLFDLAQEAASRDSLESISFDPVYHYPTSIQLLSIPDLLSHASAGDLSLAW